MVDLSFILLGLVLLLLELVMGGNAVYAELLGTVSALLEAVLPVPQFCKNWKSKSIEGLS